MIVSINILCSLMKCFTGWHRQILDHQEPVLQKGIEIVTGALQYCLNQSSKIWDELAEVWHIAVQGKQYVQKGL